MGCTAALVAGGISADYAIAGGRQVVSGQTTSPIGEQILQSLGLDPSSAAATYGLLGIGAAAAPGLVRPIPSWVGNGLTSQRLTLPTATTQIANGGTGSKGTTLQIRSATEANAAMATAGNLAAWGGTTVTTKTVPIGTRFNMVVSEGQAKALLEARSAFGGWATPNVIPD